MAIARFLCRNDWRKRREWLRDDGADLADGGDSPLDRLVRLQRDRRLADALARLKPAEQAALRLRYWESRSDRDLVELLDLRGRSGARGLLQAARRRLRRQVEPDLA